MKGSLPLRMCTLRNHHTGHPTRCTTLRILFFVPYLCPPNFSSFVFSYTALSRMA